MSHTRCSAFLGVLLLIALPGLAQTSMPALLTDVGIDQKLDAQVPADLRFIDDTGKEVRLGNYFGKRPLVLALVYYQCPMLCTLVLNDLTRALNAMPTSVGEQFDIITVSFDPRETPQLAAEKKQQYLRSYGRKHAQEGWHFLTGNQESIRALTDAVGFRYTWDVKSQQFVHASGVIVLTPQGKVSRYFYGIDYSAKDLRLGLSEAANGTIGSPAEKVLLYCFKYDPSTGRYSLAVMRLLRVAALITLFTLGGFIVHANRKDRAAKPRKNKRRLADPN
jgi:protein SCO1/2